MEYDIRVERKCGLNNIGCELAPLHRDVGKGAKIVKIFLPRPKLRVGAIILSVAGLRVNKWDYERIIDRLRNQNYPVKIRFRLNENYFKKKRRVNEINNSFFLWNKHFNSSVLHCPGKHLLEGFQTPRNGYTCDCCTKSFARNKVFYDCFECFFLICGDCANVVRTGGNPWPRDRKILTKDTSHPESKQPPLIRSKSDVSQSCWTKDRSRLASILKELENLGPLFDDYTNLNTGDDKSEEDIDSSKAPVYRTVKSAPILRSAYTTRHVSISKYEQPNCSHLDSNKKKAHKVLETNINSELDIWDLGFGSDRKRAATSPSSPKESSSLLHQNVPKVLIPTQIVENRKENVLPTRNFRSDDRLLCPVGKPHQQNTISMDYNCNSSLDGSEGSDLTKFLNETGEWLTKSEQDFLPKEKARISDTKQKAELGWELFGSGDLQNSDFQDASSLIKLGAIKCDKDKLSLQQPLSLEHVSASSDQIIFDDEIDLGILSPSCVVLESVQQREYNTGTTTDRDFACTAESSSSPEPPINVASEYLNSKSLSPPIELSMALEQRKPGLLESTTNSSNKLSVSLGNMQDSKDQVDVGNFALDIKSSGGKKCDEEEQNYKLLDEVPCQKSGELLNVKSLSHIGPSSELRDTGTYVACVGDAPNQMLVRAQNQSCTEIDEDNRELQYSSPSLNERSLGVDDRNNSHFLSVSQETNIQSSSISTLQVSSDLTSLKWEEINTNEEPKLKWDRDSAHARIKVEKENVEGFESCANQFELSYDASDNQSVKKNNINLEGAKKPCREDSSKISKNTSMGNYTYKRVDNRKNILDVSDRKNNKVLNPKLSPSQKYVSSMSIHRNSIAKENEKPSETLALSSLNAPLSPIIRVNKSVCISNASLKDVSNSAIEENKSTEKLQAPSIPVVAKDNSGESLLVREEEPPFSWRSLGRFRATTEPKIKALRGSAQDRKSPRSGVKRWRKSGRKRSTGKDFSTRLKPGLKVKVTGVKYGHHEQVGTVLHYIPDKKRYLVQLKDSQKSFKDVNLVVVEKDSPKKMGLSSSKDSVSSPEMSIPIGRPQRPIIERRSSKDTTSPRSPSLSRSPHPEKVIGLAGTNTAKKPRKQIKIVTKGKITAYNIPKKKGVQIHV